MAEVNLTLVANNQEYIKSLLDASAANNKFFGDFAKGAKQNEELWEGMAEGIDQQLKEMGMSSAEFFAKFNKGAQQQSGIIENLKNDLKSYQDAKIKATSTAEIDKYNKKIKETENEIKKLNGQANKSDQGLNKVNSSAKKAGSSIDFLKASYLKVLGVVGAVTGAVAAFVAIMKTSSAGADFFERKVAGLKASYSVLASEVTKSTDKIAKNEKGISKLTIVWNMILAQLTKQSIPKMAELAAKMTLAQVAAEKYTQTMLDLEDAERAQIVPRAEANKQIALAKLLYEDETLSIDKRIKALEKSLQLEIETTQKEIEHQNLVIANLEVIKKEKEKANQDADEADLKLQNAIAKRVDLETQSAIKRRKVEQTLNRARNELNKEAIENHKEFLKQLEDLDKRYRESQIEMLTGKDRIDAEEKFALEEVNIMQANLTALGNLTQTQYAKLEGLRTVIKKKATQERIKLDNEERLKIADNKRGLLDTFLRNAEDEIELADLTEEQKLEAKIDAYKKTIDKLSELTDIESQLMVQGLKKAVNFMEKELTDIESNKEFSIWRAIGLDPDSREGQRQIEGIKIFTDSMVDSINTILEAEVELASQRRQQAEDRINDLESQLEDELDLREQGLANNVNTVKKELEEAKKAREQAVEEERKIQKAQAALDTITQISSLITASANIFKATSGILPPFGQILAIAAIGTMFSFMAAAKVKAAQAAKLEKGGYIDEYGVIHGKRHSEGGEPLNKHVEVESGEGVGVFNRSATKYYGEFLPKWVQTINNKEFPKFNINPQSIVKQTFDIKTNSMTNELKAIRSGIDSLNSNIINQRQTNYGSGTRVEIEKNRKRIIHTK